MAMHVVSSVAIDRPTEEVFDFLSNPDNQILWQPNLREVEHSGTGKGSTLREVRSVFGHRVEYNLEVTEFQENAKISWEGESIVHEGGATIARHVEVQPRGSKTLVSMEVLVDAPELETEDVGKVMAGRMLQRETDQSLLDVKDILGSPFVRRAAERHLPAL